MKRAGKAFETFFLVATFLLSSSSLLLAEETSFVTYVPVTSSSTNAHFNSLTVGSSYSSETPPDGTAIVSGSVGIGTTTPGTPLHIQKGYDGGHLRLSFPGTDNFGELGMVTYTGSSSSPSKVWLGQNLASGTPTTHSGPTQSNANTPSWLSVWDGDTDSFSVERIAPGGGSTPTNFLTINSTGNVGIGTTGPNTRLEVANSGADARLRIGSTGDASAAVLDFYSTHSNAGGRNWSIRTNDTVFGDFNLYQSNARLGDPTSAGTSALYLSASRNVGIGTSDPGARLHLKSPPGANTALLVETISNTGGPELILERSRVGPAPVQSGDILGHLLFRGFDGAVYDSAARIVGEAAANWSATSHPTRIKFRTTPGNSVNPVERLGITEDGTLEFPGIPTASAPATAPAGRARIYYDSTRNLFLISKNSHVYETLQEVIDVKPVDEEVSNSTALQDDNDFQFTMGAFELWQFEINAFFDYPAGADWKVKLNGPALGASGWLRATLFEFNAKDSVSNASDNYVGWNLTDYSTVASFNHGGAKTTLIVIKGFIQTGPTAGTFVMQWAQRVARPTATKVLRGSYLKANRIS
ncbi:MAG: hypothetical protein HYZ90_01635 [Candidatus Omnitrophica bacterium]|nr:hypothetical protein [Candidatus Omnitrophota bacterium]